MERINIMSFDKLVRCPSCNCKFPARTNYLEKLHEKKSSHQVAVETFMRLGGQELPSKPTIPDVEIRRLRAELILEECIETIRSLGFKIDPEDDNLFLEERYKPNLVEIVDGCSDILVVTTGTLSACGVADIRPIEIVNENNLAKFKWSDSEVDKLYEDRNNFGKYLWTRFKIGDEIFTCVKDSNGKIIKPPSHKKPSLDKELEEQSK